MEPVRPEKEPLDVDVDVSQSLSSSIMELTIPEKEPLDADEKALDRLFDIRRRIKAGETTLKLGESGFISTARICYEQSDNIFNLFIEDQTPPTLVYDGKGDPKPRVYTPEEHARKYARLMALPVLVHVMFNEENEIEYQTDDWNTANLGIIEVSLVPLTEQYFRLIRLPCDKIVSSCLLGQDREKMGSLKGVIYGKNVDDLGFIYIQTRVGDSFVSYLMECP
jgi:hypothetical protein